VSLRVTNRYAYTTTASRLEAAPRVNASPFPRAQTVTPPGKHTRRYSRAAAFNGPGPQPRAAGSARA